MYQGGKQVVKNLTWERPDQLRNVIPINMQIE